MSSKTSLSKDNPIKSEQAKIISSGSLRLDIALGTGGYPRGIIIEICGPQASGKSTLGNHAVAEAQRVGGTCAWIDADQTFSAQFAHHCGVKVEDLYYSDINYLDGALDILERLAKSGVFMLIVLDSIPGLISNSESSRDLEMATEPISFSPLSETLARIASEISHNGTIVLFTNQFETKLSAIYHRLSAEPYRLALKLRSSIRIRLKAHDNIEMRQWGTRIDVQITKNKFRPFLNSTNFDIMYVQGINKSTEVFDLGVFLKKVEIHSEGYSFRSINLGKTPEQAIDFIERDDRIRNEIESEIRRLLIPKY